MEQPKFEKPNKKEEGSKFEEIKDFFKRDEILKDVDTLIRNFSDKVEIRKIIAGRYSDQFEGTDSEEIFNAWFEAFKEKISNPVEDSSNKEE